MTDPRPIGLITAIPEELADLAASLDETDARSIAGLTFRSGNLEGRSVVLVESGIGKVNAALVATLLLHEFGCRALVFSGVAGGLDPDLAVGDVVIATRLIQHDYGALVEGRIRPYQPGVPPLPGVPEDHGYDVPESLVAAIRTAVDDAELPPLSAAATGAGQRRPHIAYGPVLTGDTFLNCTETRDQLATRFAGLAVEMEGAAIAQVAERFAAPVVVIRALSDLAGKESHMDFAAFLSEAAAVASFIVRRVITVV
ncbi:MAG TPA: 5'-methylthioadenosine/adenosylhomocysteine nucleosidase [Alphaproteobacteria bacterium]|nr:5'-methylthioadenosine/adenosylhomocysteine nucleosidase [Alphaproteobacteria bacterium]